MRHHEQTQILHPAKLKEEAEAEVEEPRDVQEVLKNLKLLAQLDRAKSPEEYQNVRGRQECG